MSSSHTYSFREDMGLSDFKVVEDRGRRWMRYAFEARGKLYATRYHNFSRSSLLRTSIVALRVLPSPYSKYYNFARSARFALDTHIIKKIDVA